MAEAAGAEQWRESDCGDAEDGGGRDSGGAERDDGAEVRENVGGDGGHYPAEHEQAEAEAGDRSEDADDRAFDDGGADDAVGRDAEGEHGGVFAAAFVAGDAGRVEGDQEREQQRDRLGDAEDAQEVVHVAAERVGDRCCGLDGGDAGDGEEGSVDCVRPIREAILRVGPWLLAAVTKTVDSTPRSWLVCEAPGGADAEAGAAAEEAVRVDAAGEADERVDRGEDEDDCERVLPERHADEGAAGG